MNKVNSASKVVSVFLAMCLLFSVCTFSVHAEEIQPYEFNQWTRYYSDFSFDTFSYGTMERSIESGMIQGTSAGLGALFGGVGGAVAGGAIGGAISSYATDCTNKFYSKFGDIGYGTVITGRYGSKLRIGYFFYSDSKRTNLVASYTYATDHYPI